MMKSAKRCGKQPGNILLCSLAICCMFAFLSVYTLINMRTLAQFCNSDVYADMQVARRMWEQKTLFPEGWAFGNQFYVVATPVLAALFYGITGNINLAMGLATEMMTILIFLSLGWLLRELSGFAESRGRNPGWSCAGCCALWAWLVSSCQRWFWTSPCGESMCLCGSR